MASVTSFGDGGDTFSTLAVSVVQIALDSRRIEPRSAFVWILLDCSLPRRGGTFLRMLGTN